MVPRVRFFSALLAMICLWTRVSGVRNITSGVAKHIRSVGFPEGSNMGIFFALGVPVDLPDKSVQLSLYFEANYGVPGEWNGSYYYDDPSLHRRSLDRKVAYQILLSKLNTHGYSGEACLCKMICEVANEPFTPHGLLEDVLHVLFTPSSSQEEDLPHEFTEAERVSDCEDTYRDCPASPLALISQYVTQ